MKNPLLAALLAAAEQRRVVADQPRAPRDNNANSLTSPALKWRVLGALAVALIWFTLNMLTTAHTGRRLISPTRLFTFISTCNAQVIDVAGGSLDDGGRLIQWPNRYQPNQLWAVERVSGDRVRLHASQSGLLATAGRSFI